MVLVTQTVFTIMYVYIHDYIRNELTFIMTHYDELESQTNSAADMLLLHPFQRIPLTKPAHV